MSSTRNHNGTNIQRSPYYGALQAVVDSVFRDAYDGFDFATVQPDEIVTGPKVSRMNVILAAEAADLPEDLQRIVSLLPPGNYTRERLTTQLNSAISGHAWGQVYGTVA